MRWYERRQDALLLLALRQTAVKDQIEIKPEAVRKLYDERPELFTAPEEVTLQEIMVQTRAEAVELKERIEAGEDMGALADEYTLRTAGKGAQGTFHIHAFEQSFYRELIDAVRNAEVGRLYGPLSGDGAGRASGRTGGHASGRRVLFGVQGAEVEFRQRSRTF